MQTPALSFSSSSPAPREEPSRPLDDNEEGAFGAALATEARGTDEPRNTDAQPRNDAADASQRASKDASSSKSERAEASSEQDASTSKDEAESTKASSEEKAKDAKTKKKGATQAAARGENSEKPRGAKTTNTRAHGQQPPSPSSEARPAHPEEAAYEKAKGAANASTEGTEGEEGTAKKSGKTGRPPAPRTTQNASASSDENGKPVSRKGSTTGSEATTAQKTETSDASQQRATRSASARKADSTRKTASSPHTDTTAEESSKAKHTPRREHAQRSARAGKQTQAAQQAASKQTSASADASTAKDTRANALKPDADHATSGARSKHDGGASTTGQDARERQQQTRRGTRRARSNAPSPQPSADARAAKADADNVKPTSFSANWEQAAAEAKPDADALNDKVTLPSGESNSTARTGLRSSEGRAPSFMNRTRLLAWLRSMGRSPAYTQDQNGWKTLEMQLKNGDGLMTVQTRRGKDNMSISVTFSDTRMRAQAAASAHQLQDLLQSQYDTNIDFSLTDHGSNDAHQQAASEHARQENRALGQASDSSESEASSKTSLQRRALAAGAQHEWIG